MPTPPKLDHTVINVLLEMDSAERAFKALGFHLTDRGYHSLGSINHLMMFDTDYIELIGMPAQLAEGKPGRPDIMSAPPGINGIVFKSDNIDETYAHLQDIGMADKPPNSFSRPVKLADETRDACFRTVHLRSDIFPAGRVYYCEHGTPELVWRPEWQRHENGALSMPEFVIASEHPQKEAEVFAKLLFSDVTGSDDSLSVRLDGATITLLAPGTYRDRYGDLASSMQDRSSVFGAMVIKVNDLGAVRSLSREAKVPIIDEAGRVVLSEPDFNSVLEFVTSV